MVDASREAAQGRWKHGDWTDSLKKFHSRRKLPRARDERTPEGTGVSVGLEFGE